MHDIELELATNNHELDYYCEILSEISDLKRNGISTHKTYKLKGLKCAVMKLRLEGYVVEFVEVPGNYSTIEELDNACYHIIMWGKSKEEHLREMEENGNKLAVTLFGVMVLFCLIATYFLNTLI